jgi:hypothetical protein
MMNLKYLINRVPLCDADEGHFTVQFTDGCSAKLFRKEAFMAMFCPRTS